MNPVLIKLKRCCKMKEDLNNKKEDFDETEFLNEYEKIVLSGRETPEPNPEKCEFFEEEEEVNVTAEDVMKAIDNLLDAISILKDFEEETHMFSNFNNLNYINKRIEEIEKSTTLDIAEKRYAIFVLSFQKAAIETSQSRNQK